MKSTPNRGVKEYLKPHAYKQWEPLLRVTACLLHNESVSYGYAARLSRERRSRSESESEMGAQLYGIDPKPGELPMARVKSR